MPKVSRKRIVLAKEEPTGLLERIVISNPHKFDHVAKRRRLPKPVYRPLVHRPFDPIRAQEADERIKRLRRLAHLIQKRKLLDRLSDTKPPLLERIEPRTPEYQPPDELPPGLHFRKTKILRRIEEYGNIFEATVERLEPVFLKLKTAKGISSEVREKLEKMGTEFNTLWTDLDQRGSKLTNKQWRYIKRDLKRIGRVSFTNLSTRFVEVCNELAALDITFAY